MHPDSEIQKEGERLRVRASWVRIRGEIEKRMFMSYVKGDQEKLNELSILIKHL